MATEDSPKAATSPPASTEEPRPDETQMHSPSTANVPAAGVAASPLSLDFGPPTVKQTSENSRDLIGRTIGKYAVLQLLGQGGMGVVYKAHDPAIDRNVALKVLANAYAADVTALARFQSEARSVGKIQHSNVAAIYDVGEQSGVHYLAMELLSGESLDRSGKLGALRATEAMIDACKGLAAAHAAGLIHRDIKPANFLRGLDGTVKITDFGLAKSQAAGENGMTQAGMVVGTPYYMSPEQFEARPLDLRSDLYSMGATYFTLLTGKNPFHGTVSIPQLMYAHCHGPVPDPTHDDPAVPAACAAIVAKCMAKKAEDRYQSAAAMQADLEAVAMTMSGRAPILLPSQSQRMAASPTVTGAAAATATASPQPLPAPLSSRNTGRLFVAGVLALGVLAAVFILKPWKAAPLPPIAEGLGPIRVGILHSMSGTMSTSASPVADATLLAIEEINAAGGLSGRKIVPVVVDGKSDADVFAKEAERLIAEEKVEAIFGCWTSAGRKLVKPIVEKHDHLLLYPVQYEGLETSPCIFYFGAAPNQQIIPAVDWAFKTQNKKTFFLVGNDYVFPQAANEIIEDQLRVLGGIVVGEMYINNDAPNVQPVVDAIVKRKPDMILNTINGDINVAFFRALRAAGITPDKTPTMSFSIGEQGLRSMNAKEIQGDYAAWTYFQAIASKENAEFVKKFQTKFPARAITDPMEAAYVSVQMWANAVREAGISEPKAVRRALLSQRMSAPSGDLRIEPESQHCWKTPRIGQIQSDGTFKIIHTAAEPVLPIPYPKTRKASEWNIFLTDLYTGWGNRWTAPPLK